MGKGWKALQTLSSCESTCYGRNMSDTKSSPVTHVIFRSYVGDNQKQRPSFYSKYLCTASLARAVDMADGPIDLLVLQDGPDRHSSVQLLIDVGARVEEIPKRGNAGSYLSAIGRAVDSAWSDDDVVYFSEDDYLYTESAMSVLREFTLHVPEADFVTLYDHPDQTSRARRSRRRVEIVSPRHYWRSSTSTCMSFGARVGALREERRAFEAAGKRGPYPLDHPMWLALEAGGVGLLVQPLVPRLAGRRASLGRYAIQLMEAVGRLRRRPYRLLVTPVPSVGTHSEIGVLAPAVDWDDTAHRVMSWAAARTNHETEPPPRRGSNANP